MTHSDAPTPPKISAAVSRPLLPRKKGSGELTLVSAYIFATLFLLNPPRRGWGFLRPTVCLHAAERCPHARAFWAS